MGLGLDEEWHIKHWLAIIGYVLATTALAAFIGLLIWTPIHANVQTGRYRNSDSYQRLRLQRQEQLIDACREITEAKYRYECLIHVG